MTGHVKWTNPPHLTRADWGQVKAVRPEILRNTRAWVQGYILALEDTIQDIEAQRSGYFNDQDAQMALNMILEKVQETLASAQRTLDVLNEVTEVSEP